MRVVLGRGQIGQLHLKDASISRKHCEIEPMGNNRFRVKDLGSTNGTYLDGRMISEDYLSGESRLTLGEHLLKYSLSEVYFLATNQDRASVSLEPEQMSNLVQQTNLRESNDKHRRAFAELETYYASYNEEVLRIEKNKVVVIGGIRYIPTIIVALLSLVLPREYMVWAGAVALPTLLVSIMLSSRLQANYTDRLYQMREDFKNNWICPACSKSLGSNSWQMLKRQGKCPHCSIRWDDSEGM